MTPAALERHQVWFYLVAIAVGLVTGTVLPDVGHVFDALLWPVISVLLFVTFVQIPMTSIATAFRDIRFLAATLLGNFAVLPLLVLLVPCTDWFITFTQLAKGATARATAVTPVNLVVQILLLPAYLWLMADADVGTVFALGDVWPALVVVLVPLGIAIVSDLWFRRSATTEKTRDALGWGPVPLLSLVVFMIAAAHVGSVRDSLGVFPLVITAAVVFIAVALVLARLIASTSGLPAAQGRTLAFSFTTRNSFVVLPFALSLPSGWELVSIVIVMQSLVELLGMVFCIWFVPKYLFPDDTAAPPQR